VLSDMVLSACSMLIDPVSRGANFLVVLIAVEGVAIKALMYRRQLRVTYAVQVLQT